MFPTLGLAASVACHPDSESEWQQIMKEELGQVPEPGDSNQAWDTLLQEEVEEIQRSCEEVEEATRLTPPTPPDSDEESSDSSSCPKLTVWWAQWLFHAVRSLGFGWPASDQNKPLLVMSACCGCSAESAVLQG